MNRQAASEAGIEEVTPLECLASRIGEARAASRGLWADCGGADVPVQEERPPPVAQPGGDCDPSYPDVCIPPYPPDLDCGEIPQRRFRVVGSDPHGFDGDSDGIGCETG